MGRTKDRTIHNMNANRDVPNSCRRTTDRRIRQNGSYERPHEVAVHIVVIVALRTGIYSNGRIQVGLAIRSVSLTKLYDVVAQRVGTNLLIVALQFATTIILVNVTIAATIVGSTTDFLFFIIIRDVCFRLFLGVK